MGDETTREGGVRENRQFAIGAHVLGMYSLYRPEILRAWLRDVSPTDIVVNVGGRHFAAHKSVLTTHSGYLKALLAPDPALTSVTVPNVSPEAFAPLLSFMYSGFLDLSPDNIYAVLLGAHLLHMPRALDFCRAFLVHHQQRRSAMASFCEERPMLVKPIPSRKMLPVLFGFPPWTGYARRAPTESFPLHQLLPTAVAGKSPFRAVGASAVGRQREEEEPAPSPPPPQVEEPKVPSPGPSRASPLAIPSTSSAPQLTRTPSTSPCSSLTSDRSDKLRRRKRENSETFSGNAKVIIDVACCDGPVRFHRVLNDNYGLTLDDILTDSTAARDNRPESFDRKSPPVADAAEDEYHQQRLPKASVVSHVEEKPPEDHSDSDSQSNHNPPSSGSSTFTNATAGNSGDPLYKCLYCNHTFKSHYCYQKHTRRHINPVTLDLVKLADKLKAEIVKEVKLLDMNVQYYPCKTCGSKFPSYYFVHKHRKMCHANETDAEDSMQE